MIRSNDTKLSYFTNLWRDLSYYGESAPGRHDQTPCHTEYVPPCHTERSEVSCEERSDEAMQDEKGNVASTSSATEVFERSEESLSRHSFSVQYFTMVLPACRRER